MYFFPDPLYLLFLVPSMLLAMWAQSRVKGAYAQYAQVPTQRGVTGLDAARIIMQRYGLNQVTTSRIGGQLTDNYDPRSKTISLSESSVNNSVAAVAIVAHELGHAMQDSEHYAALKLRAGVAPAVQVGGWVGPIMMGAGAMLGYMNLIWVGIIAFALTTGFALLTLPVEFDASRRALRFLDETGLLNDTELGGAKKVLDAAALTYIAAASQAVLQLIYFVYRYTNVGRRRD